MCLCVFRIWLSGSHCDAVHNGERCPITLTEEALVEAVLPTGPADAEPQEHADSENSTILTLYCLSILPPIHTSIILSIHPSTHISII